jgi:putative toxin-antitoxin system antitoxin component (TIGR02293 family)
MPKVAGLTLEKPTPTDADEAMPWLKTLQSEAVLHEQALQLLKDDLLSHKSTAKVFFQAESIWQDSHSALEWLAKPHPELNDQIPAALLKSAQGLERVQNLLGAIEYGFPA